MGVELTQPELRSQIAVAASRLRKASSIIGRASRRLRIRLAGDVDPRLRTLAQMQLDGVVRVGRYTYGIPEVLSFGLSSPRLEIGAFCSISDKVEIFLNGNHNANWVTTYPFRLQLGMTGMLADGHPSSRGPVVIGNDVWVAWGATIMSGVKIGDGAIVGAHAVVTRDVAPYSLVAGNPARHIRHRFSEASIAALLQIRWWEWSDEQIRDAVPFLCSSNIEAFVERYSR